MWTATAAGEPAVTRLAGEVTAEVAIVGGGFTGLSAALHLAEAGVDAVVLEGQRIGHGGSGRNMGLVNAGLWLAQAEIERIIGKADGERLNGALFNSPDLVFDLIDRHGIDCEATRAGTMHLAKGRKALEGLAAKVADLRSRGAPVSLLDKAETARRTGTGAYEGALFDPRAGTIQPLGYVRGLARAALAAGARIHAPSPARRLERVGDGWRIEADGGAVRARRVVLATNAYTDDLVPGLATGFTPVSFLVLATAPLGENVGRTILAGGEGTWDTRKVMTTFRRDAAGRLIFGSMGGLTTHDPLAFAGWAERMKTRLFPQLGENAWTHAWTGQVAMTGDHLPRIVAPAEGIWAVIGYNGRGIGPGTVFGKAIAEAVVHDDEGALPLAPGPLRPEPLPSLRARMYEAAFQAVHLWERI
ncbi:MAG: FAD-dependent oxidoreductase [Rhizobiales bacterium]|nr:FAD-dependent oxidoreductase [Hyphomicrobiales bacterium]